MMKITSLHVYPIKALRGISLQSAVVTPQGIAHDRSFILLKVLPSGDLRKMQLSSFPECALFSQEIEPPLDAGDAAPTSAPATIVVRYHAPSEPLVPFHPSQREALRVPLELGPDAVSALDEVEVDLHGSPARGRRMGDPYDAWFSACLGYDAVLVYIGSGRRRVLGTFAPGSADRAAARATGGGSSWVPSLIASHLPWSASGDQGKDDDDDYWLTFTDCSPLLVASESSLAAVSARLPPSEPAQMAKFRPNIVLDGVGEPAWAEDYWAELRVVGDDSADDSADAPGHTLALTANCVRCSSLDVDYATGRRAVGETGTVLKKLMKDRRVDVGSRWSPVFGRYAFPPATRAGRPEPAFTVRVGDDVRVLRRNDDRTVWDWPGLGSSSSSAKPSSSETNAVPAAS